MPSTHWKTVPTRLENCSARYMFANPFVCQIPPKTPTPHRAHCKMREINAEIQTGGRNPCRMREIIPEIRPLLLRLRMTEMTPTAFLSLRSLRSLWLIRLGLDPSHPSQNARNQCRNSHPSRPPVAKSAESLPKISSTPRIPLPPFLCPSTPNIPLRLPFLPRKSCK